MALRCVVLILPVSKFDFAFGDASTSRNVLHKDGRDQININLLPCVDHVTLTCTLFVLRLSAKLWTDYEP